MITGLDFGKIESKSSKLMFDMPKKKILSPILRVGFKRKNNNDEHNEFLKIF